MRGGFRENVVELVRDHPSQRSPEEGLPDRRAQWLQHWRQGSDDAVTVDCEVGKNSPPRDRCFGECQLRGWDKLRVRDSFHRTISRKVSDEDPPDFLMRLGAVGIAAPYQIDSRRRDK